LSAITPELCRRDNPKMRWDLFCRVVDNFGDVGFCWRLAADLAGRGHSCRLWIDDPSALRWMAPAGRDGIEVRNWTDADGTATPGEVVVEAFGCEPPAAFIAAMAEAGRARAPTWINLEHLSAEAYVERCHGLASPQAAGPGRGLTKWFFYPGFTPRTGGLLREPGLLEARQRFDRQAWLADQGWAPRGGERVVTLFCYDNLRLADLLRDLAERPTLVLAAPGAAQRALAAMPTAAARQLRSVALPWLTQTDYDRLLWSADLNLVRGEDSFVRAQWAGAPFVWQIYPQHDGVHADKLAAFLAIHTADADAAIRGDIAADITSIWRAWNGLAPWPVKWPGGDAWRRVAERWRGRLLMQADLTTQLIDFAAGRQDRPRC
jgi:uncharacterized repeat protein (TIGR03837 family)